MYISELTRLNIFNILMFGFINQFIKSKILMIIMIKKVLFIRIFFRNIVKYYINFLHPNADIPRTFL